MKIYLTYQFETTGYTENVSFGHSNAIHCNYIDVIETDSLVGQNVNLFFNDEDKFPFMVNSSGITSGGDGYGWSATKFNVLMQIVDDGNELLSDKWKTIDVTDQIPNHVIGSSINKKDLIDGIYKVNLLVYNEAPYYDLSYLSIPSSSEIDKDRLTFGEEVFFYGNIETDIKSVAYTTDLPIVLPLNEFNTSTNPTWDGVSDVQISEIALYDDNNNMVAIAKLRQPISKNSQIARTILFALDF